MKQYSVMIKPSSALCNMRCAYCFYADEAAVRETPRHGIMTETVARAILEKFSTADADRYAFVFQGGEPTLAGFFVLDFIS